MCSKISVLGVDNKIDIFDVLEKIEEQTPKYRVSEFIYNTNKSEDNNIYNLEKTETRFFTHSFIYKVNSEIKIIKTFISIIKYIATTVTIFAVLLLTANYSAYISVAKSYIFADQIKMEAKSLLSSLEASQITENIKKDIRIKQNINSERLMSWNTRYSFKKLTLDTSKNKPSLDIQITPYENRLLIPQIGKNIPLISIGQQSVSWPQELENIFMKELEDWVVKYPSSTSPWEEWNTFIFGHSSNYPWVRWDFNHVFANLNNLNIWDEVIIYYGQEKFVYRIKEKKVVRPGYTEILKRNKWKDELTLMTCWPIGTTIDRLLVIWELVE